MTALRRICAGFTVLAWAIVLALSVAVSRAESVIGTLPNGVKVCRSNSCLKDASGKEIVFPCSTLEQCDAAARAEIVKYGANVTSGTNTWDFRKQYPVSYRKPAPLPPADTDADGVPDSADKCPSVPATTPDGCPATPPAETWSACATEGGRCAFTGERTVRYGAPAAARACTMPGLTEPCWVVRRFTGGTACTNAVFGDPIDGTVKRCELSSVTPAPQAEPPAPTLGSANLSWTAPTERTDGTALTNLAGYVIAYGTTCEGRSLTIPIDNPGTTTYRVENLAPASYCFSVSAIDADGNQSPPSPTATKVIR